MLVVAPEAQLSKTTLSFQHGRALTSKIHASSATRTDCRKKRALVSDFGTLADDFGAAYAVTPATRCASADGEQTEEQLDKRRAPTHILADARLHAAASEQARNAEGERERQGGRMEIKKA
ncbi:hypothetical protein MRX96_013403 [Rhipicephalus microplus]